ncbi:hypothetical protein EST38_g13131, partial [Candolleomyces aberdarensis]
LKMHWMLTDEYLQLTTQTLLNLAGGIELSLRHSITQIPIVHALDQFNSLQQTQLAPIVRELVEGPLTTTNFGSVRYKEETTIVDITTITQYLHGRQDYQFYKLRVLSYAGNIVFHLLKL